MDRRYIIEDWTPSSPWYRWARNYGERNLWRVAHVIGNDLNDFLSEAAHTYLTTRIRYGAQINSPQHFMRMFQMSLSCWITDLSNKDSRIKEGLAKISRSEPAVVPDADLQVLLGEGSSELKEVLNIFFNSPKEVMEALRNEARSCSPKNFFNRVLSYAGINQSKSQELIKELNDLLG